MRTLLLLIVFSLAAGFASGQLPLSVEFSTGAEVPSGADADIYIAGAAGTLSARVYPANLQVAYLAGDLGYGYMASEAQGLSVSRLSIGARAGIDLELIQGLRAPRRSS